MALPKQVQKQLDAANAVLETVNAPPALPTESPPTPPQPTAAPIEQPTPPAPAPVATPPAPQDDFKHKYSVLQGMFNRQGQDLASARAEVERLKAQPPAPPPAPTPEPRPTTDPKDVEAFGLDMVTMVQRVAGDWVASARQQIAARFDQVEQAIAALQDAVSGTSQTVALTAEQQFFNQLDRLVPNWEEINQMDAFKAWLMALDPVYSLPRQAALTAAREAGDPQRAANVFLAFVATLPPPAPPAPIESPTPRGNGAPPPLAPASRQPVRGSEIESFYADVRRGLYRSNPQELARLEAFYNAALAEGRVVNG